MIRFKIMTDDNGRTRWIRLGDFELQSPEQEQEPEQAKKASE